MGKGGETKRVVPMPSDSLSASGIGDPSLSTKKTDFYWSDQGEPHAIRRKVILAKYPEIKQLYGPCPWLKVKVLAAVSVQLALAFAFSRRTAPLVSPSYSYGTLFFLTAYIVGGTLNHMLMMALHELSHNLGFKNLRANRTFSVLVANLPIGIPAAISFKRYHMDHHKYQGVDQVDVDIPTDIEGRIFQTKATKLVFVLLQGFFYSLRPAFVNPKPPGKGELYNWIAQLSFDAAVIYFWGPYSMGYLLASTYLGMGLHPVAGHFIAEHFCFPQHKEGTTTSTSSSSSSSLNTTLVVPPETFSYYGPCNYFTLNVGYHNEHHDFPFVPGSRLPKLHAIAREFYEPLPQHTSYLKVLWDFIMGSVTAYDRVKRAGTGPDVGGVLGAEGRAQSQPTTNKED